jgi:hypothetical protein
MAKALPRFWFYERGDTIKELAIAPGEVDRVYQIILDKQCAAQTLPLDDSCS